MFAADNPFLAQARVAVRMLRIVAEEPVFALKGGTAINLFYRDMPRLSVDLDLTYVPLGDRDRSLRGIESALLRIAERAERGLPRVRVHTQGAADGKLVAQQGRTTVTIEVTPVLRGSVYEPQRQRAQPTVEDTFGDLTANVLSFEDAYAGKLVAALDRQHPRDLFDVMMLLEREGVSERLMDAFAVYLASHGRPISEVLNARDKDLRQVYEREFAAMTAERIPLAELTAARTRLVAVLRKTLTPRHREFLLSVKRLEPDWSLIPIAHVRDLPGIQWKLQNLAKYRNDQPARYEEALAALEKTLEGFKP
jgi:predicted nucleotidyltransferase component of viral defense system